jgi:hypothetical protein
MATSGSYIYTITANDIIKEALLVCRAYDPNQSLESEDQETGLRSLNMMIKSWQAQGYHLWTLEDAIVFCTDSTESYDLGSTGDHSCKASDFINTEVATAGSTSDTTLVVDSSTGMAGAPNKFASDQAADVNAWSATNATLAVASEKLTITNSGAAAGYADLSLTGLTVGNSYRFTFGYEVGTSTSAKFSIISNSVELTSTTENANGTYTLDFTADQTTATFRAENVSAVATHTTVVSSANYVDQAGGDFVGIELDDGTRQWLNIVSISGTTLSLSGSLTDDVAVDNTVYTYTTKIRRPLRIRDARFQSNLSSDEIPAQLWSRSDYFAQPDKSSSGTITALYYDPKRETLGKVYVWQTANSVKSLLRFGYTEPMEYFSGNSDEPDFPSEWFLALVYNLAKIIGPQYKTNPTQQQLINVQAMEYLEDALGFDDEIVSIQFQPDYD